MSNPIVSIIMPYYKKDEYIYETVESILKQTFQNFEIIIVDDERTNQSLKIMEKLKDKDGRIIIIENEQRPATTRLRCGCSNQTFPRAKRRPSLQGVLERIESIFF